MPNTITTDADNRADDFIAHARKCGVTLKLICQPGWPPSLMAVGGDPQADYEGFYDRMDAEQRDVAATLYAKHGENYVC